MSHNDQELTDFLQAQMAAQLHISKADFLEMISCKIEHEGIANIYREKGLL